MRISDWSSDVCSSDLELRDRGGEAGAQIGICAVRGEPLLSSHSIEAAFAWFESGKPSPLIVKSNHISCVHRRALIDLILLPVRHGERITALSVHAGLWTSSALRPEENTYELQSLMRH